MFRWLASYKAVAVAVTASVGVVCATLVAQQAPPIFRANVNLVHVLASVKNAKGELVGKLQKSDFRIFDNGAEQEIKVFEPQSLQPLSVALMIDASGSTKIDLKYETDSASKFLKALLTQGNPQDAVALYSFDSDITAMRPFTHNFPSLDIALKTVKGSGGTSLYDAIYFGASDLSKRGGRKVIVVISDGGNTTSSMGIDKALKEAQLADAVIYPVVVVPITNEAGRNTGGEHALIFMAEGTGGRTFFPNFGQQLDAAFADIIAELRTQYFLGYYPQNVPLTKNPFHKLEVRLASPDLRVSARNGYYGDAEGAGSAADAPIAVTPAGMTKKK